MKIYFLALGNMKDEFGKHL